MIRLQEINEENWLQAASLSVTDEQQAYLDRPVGIIARGYVYRECRACVWAITAEDVVVGLALVRDLDEEPACYDLQQLMIDQRFQHHGYGSAALKEILDKLRAEANYSCVEVCVNKNNTAALRLYGKAGFADTGYVDPSVPDCVNLRYVFAADNADTGM